MTLGKYEWLPSGTVPREAVFPAFSEIALDKFCVALRHTIAAELGYNMNFDVKVYQERIRGDWVYELRAYMAAKKQPEVVKVSVLAFPAGWWQYFRERWFPRWWLRRWPVIMTRIETARHEQVAKVCPHLAIDGQSQHLRWLASSCGDDDLAERTQSVIMRRLLMRMVDEGGWYRNMLPPDLVGEIKTVLGGK